MEEQLRRIETETLTALDQVRDEGSLRAWYAAHLAKKSPLMIALGDLGKLPKEQRAEYGRLGNEIKRALAGLDRLTALRFSINDIRYLYENDTRFLWQF